MKNFIKVTLASVSIISASNLFAADLMIRNDQFAIDMIKFMESKGYPVEKTEERRTIAGHEGIDSSVSVERRDAHLGDFRPIADTEYRYFFSCSASRFTTDDGFYDDTFGFCIVGSGTDQFRGEWAQEVNRLSQLHGVSGFSCSGSGASMACTYRD